MVFVDLKNAAVVAVVVEDVLAANTPPVDTPPAVAVVVDQHFPDPPAADSAAV